MTTTYKVVAVAAGHREVLGEYENRDHAAHSAKRNHDTTGCRIKVVSYKDGKWSGIISDTAAN